MKSEGSVVVLIVHKSPISIPGSHMTLLHVARNSNGLSTLATDELSCDKNGSQWFHNQKI